LLKIGVISLMSQTLDKNNNTNKTLENITGTVERITFHAEDSGFCVLRVNVKGQRDLVTVTGALPSIHAGECIDASGIWSTHGQYGLQFKANTLQVLEPTTLAGIEKYLASGMIKGVGPVYAKKLVRKFGEKILEIIDETPNRLLEIDGLGPKRVEKISKAWSDQRQVRKIMVFLQSYGIGTARATRIYKRYGDTAIDQIKADPYCLARDIWGVGFKSADQLAVRMGVDLNSPQRAQAGLYFAMQEHTNDGHCACSKDDLITKAEKLLSISKDILQQALVESIRKQDIIALPFDDGKNSVALDKIYNAEQQVALHLTRLLKGKSPKFSNMDLDDINNWIDKNSEIELSSGQKDSIIQALSQKILCITGGPGVGKTTVVRQILNLITHRGAMVQLCAPTGRAAKRLAESTGLEAKTIHRLLEFDPTNGGFKRGQDFPLLCDCLILDEASMLDICLMNSLLKAIEDTCVVIFVGDIDQLPSVGPGAVLANLIDSEVLSVVRLTQIFRQAKSSQIIINAHRVNEGLMPNILDKGVKSDFYVIYKNDVENIADAIDTIILNKIEKVFGFNPKTQLQVLTPMTKGGLGSQALNIRLQQLLNPNKDVKVERFGQSFSPGDKVIQTVNNYDKNIFNGDIGIISRIDPEEGVCVIEFDGLEISYELSELDEIKLAYAITIHKSQGSEYPVVIIPMVMQHFTLLQRNLIYTAITRGKSLVILIGQKKAIGMAVKRDAQMHRLTYLVEWLKFLGENKN
jgi:exodeoxyribonuclease V alpha subunit